MLPRSKVTWNVCVFFSILSVSLSGTNLGALPTVINWVKGFTVLVGGDHMPYYTHSGNVSFIKLFKISFMSGGGVRKWKLFFCRQIKLVFQQPVLKKRMRKRVSRPAEIWVVWVTLTVTPGTTFQRCIFFYEGALKCIIFYYMQKPYI